ncbi:hypothetical protein Rumeso_04737 [Rubellimicrobium mesophilum DSM 19309]|uniref:Uncharacterized protein n=1 Tax=Rubellimicrobium mesophilum DSM 19309 TaxID=442562 RepID=A0A017HGZ7_9RHOB|nr:hypothetical protein [Rubellimicrobium mesophilum]EYD73616.1 hypothetical protein Rumeso_04737 [Rubellimicrobium mesophilum DSM 19309]
MKMFSTAGTRIYIGGPLPLKVFDYAEADFADQDWTEILGHEELGSIGDTATEVRTKRIRANRVVRFKGMREGATWELICSIDADDPGQAALIAAEKTNRNYAVRIVFPDAPDGGTPSERLCIANVGRAEEQLANADTEAAKVNFSLWINSNIVRVEAAEAAP